MLFRSLGGEPPQYGSYSPISSRSPHLAKLHNNMRNRSDTDPFILSQLTSTPGHDPRPPSRAAVAAVERRGVTNGNGLTVPGQARSNTVQRLYGRRGPDQNQNLNPVQMIDGSTSSGTDTSDTESDMGSSFGQPLMYGNPAAVNSSPMARNKFSFDSLELEEGCFNFNQEDAGARVFSC